MNTKVYKLLETDRVIDQLFTWPEKKFHIRELARMSGMSVRWVSETVRSLEEEGFVNASVIGNIKMVASNSGDKKFICFKRLWNLKMLYESGIVDHLDENLHPKAIILFGSYSRGEDRSTSDIDIAVVGGLRKDINVDAFEKKLFRKISLHRLEHSDSGNREFRNTISNGIVLSGYVKVV